MRTYKVPNKIGVFVTLSDHDLERESKLDGPVPVQIAHAAALAKRKDFLPRIRQTLSVPDRAQKLSAAYALLALRDQESISLLDAKAQVEKDEIPARLFRLIALRLRGVEQLAKCFFGDEEHQTSMLVPSVYGGYPNIEEADIRFLVAALEAYVEKSLKWIRKLKMDYWENDVALIMSALATQASIDLMKQLHLSQTRTKACNLLRMLLAFDIDDDIREDVQSLLAEWGHLPP